MLNQLVKLTNAEKEALDKQVDVINKCREAENLALENVQKAHKALAEYLNTLGE